MLLLDSNLNEDYSCDMYSPIALCCISLDEKKVTVTEPEIYSLFKEFASISKILIFQHDPILKCFIEFSNSESLEKALKNVENISPTFGKISLYHSKKDSLLNAYEFHSQVSLSKEHHNFAKEDYHSGISRHENGGSFMFKITDDDNDEEDLYAVRMGQKTNLSIGQSQSTDEFSKADLSKTDTTLKWMKMDEIDSSELLFLRKDLSESSLQKSEGLNVVVVENYELDNRSVKFLMNAIGCFGNLLKIVVNFNLQRVFVEMQNAHQANLVRLYLDGFDYFGCQLKVRHAPINCLRKPDALEDSGIKFYELENWTFRFKRHLSIKFNPPSKMLHFTSLSSRIDHLILFSIISQIHEPLKMYKLNQNFSQSQMFLAEFNSVNESLEVLSVLHNKILDKKSLKISFSHPKIS